MISYPTPHLPLGIAVLFLLSRDATSFSPSSWHSSRSPKSPSLKEVRRLSSIILPASLSSSAILNDTLVNGEPATTTALPFEWNNTFAIQAMEDLTAFSSSMEYVAAPSEEDDEEATSRLVAARSSLDDTEKRLELKRELARVAITSFHPDAVEQEEPRTAECIMEELEGMTTLPIRSPAMHHSLNAHWSFVFTGVPTVGMRLITLLSRISTCFPFEILDFRDVALCVTDDQSQAKAVVEVKVCGAVEVLLEVCTSLRRPTEEDMEGEYEQFKGEAGTLLLEHFQGVCLNGVKIPTPKSWHTTRTLEITYMDKDIMVARTSGGEPHLLLRNSPLCYTPEEMILHTDEGVNTIDMEEEIEECDIDGGTQWTEFFSEAIEMYGERITRCLVDRDFGREEYEKKEKRKGGEWWKSLAGGVNLGEQWGVGDD